MNGFRNGDIMKYYSTIKRKCCHCNNLNCPWEHYAKWKKSDRERQIPYDFTYMWNLKNKTQFIDIENRGKGVLEEDEMDKKGKKHKLSVVK